MLNDELLAMQLACLIADQASNFQNFFSEAHSANLSPFIIFGSRNREFGIGK